MEDEVNLYNIDFGDLDYDFNIQEVTTNDPEIVIEGDELSSVSVTKTSGSGPTATGANARLLLDSTDGRNALINDLEELSSFLRGMAENQHDQSGGIGGHKKPPGASGICLDTIAPIYQQIMQVYSVRTFIYLVDLRLLAIVSQ